MIAVGAISSSRFSHDTMSIGTFGKRTQCQIPPASETTICTAPWPIFYAIKSKTVLRKGNGVP